ncbi:ATP-binding protein [Actinokineospora terrae]|uniref:Non-specific serine/threonine protein kinase n=1 Tax=Actinokineospora terrae TaxID=155974 RepID=A0A1H9QEF9_9PSEU|nr:LuxR C-terminal-related transcriptional regulator [Actinokineospora terrae]SER58565.1 non-specific serine/threonine protein kinase [Actinokineospora terrae]
MATGDELTAARRVPVSTFVGRDRDLRLLADRVRATRMLTVHGAGGVGKTELVRRMVPDYPAPVHFADLTQVADPGLLATVVADSVGVRDHSARPPLAALVDHFGERAALLVLDNCEHLAGEVADLAAALLASAPALRVVATSRIAPLHVPGERLYRLEPLALPAPGAALADVLATDSVRLLVDRAGEATPDFAVTAANLADVVHLVRRLDGLPLATTLAAARLRTLTVGQLAHRLDSAFTVLASRRRDLAPHHRALVGVLDCTHRLCDVQEQLAWERLSVFEAGFDLDAAEDVCADGAVITRDRVLDLVDGLIQKSVLDRCGEDGVARYRMLETTRQYAGERLADRGETAQVRDRHLRHYHDFATTAAAKWFAPGERELHWVNRAVAEFANLRAAMQYASDTGGETAVVGLGIAAALANLRVWFFRGTIREGYHWLNQLLAVQPPSSPLPPRVEAAVNACWIAVCMGDKARADAALARCRALAPRDPATAFAEGTHRLVINGDSAAIHQLARARQELSTAGRRGAAHMAGLFWGMAAAFLGTATQARAVSAEIHTEATTHGAAWATSWTRWVQALTELRHGSPTRAVTLFRRSLAEQRSWDERWGAVWSIHGIAWSLAAAGDHTHATQALGVTHTLRTTTGVQIIAMPPFGDLHTEVERQCLRALGLARYRELFESGAGLGQAEGQAVALAEVSTVDDPWLEITAREREVAELAAQGLSNREIAELLRIGVRTVETHVRRLLPKLGLRRRAQLPRWFADHARPRSA